MRFSDSFLEEVRDRIPISAVIGTRVTWDRKKTNAAKGDWWACCPFHGEKSPSFHCEDRKGRYHCFGCGVSGDHFRFLTELDGLSFPEAVERVADMAGIPMPVADPREQKRQEQRATLFDVMELACRFFEEMLQANAGAAARGYLRQRGLVPATISKFRLGYAPDSRNALKSHLANRNVPKELIEACGLVVYGPEIPVSYDRFRDRVMFPIEDSRGRVIAFGGRAMSADNPAKYLNSPETELFHKGNVLYNFARARSAAANSGVVIAVEGYMDVIALAQAGIENVVAPLGTAMTEEQLALLWRLSHDPVLCFDGDSAGQRAANRAVDLIFKSLAIGRSAKFAILSDGKDPDDLVRDRGRQGFDEIVNKALPLHEFFILRRRLELSTDSPEERAAFEQRLYSDIEPISDQIVRKYYRSHLRLRLTEFFSGRAKDISAEEAKRLSVSIKSNRLVSTLLGILVQYPGLLDDYIEDLMKIDIDSEPYRVFRSEIYRLFVEYEDLTVSDIYEKIDKRFFAVLNAVHGEAYTQPIRDANGVVVGSFAVARGHRLKQLFPRLAEEPPLEIVRMTLNFLFRKAALLRAEGEYLDNVDVMNAERFAALNAEMARMRDELALQESELADAYDVWGGRRSYGQYR